MRIDDPRATLLGQPGEKKTHPRGTVVALASENGRYTRFSICMQALGFNLPAGSAVKWQVGSDIAESRNQACEEMEGDWIWFIDDDHAFRDDVLMKLLDRDVDIVTPICLRRMQPFLPIPSGMDGNFLDVAAQEPDALVEVLAAGSSGMLIRKRVLDALERPWFALDHRGELPVSEDVNFCMRAREAGFKIHCDLGVRLGHITTAVVWPVYNEDMQAWLTGFTVADGAQLAIEPALIPPLPVEEGAPS